MKIVGEAENGEMLISASRDEIANLFGVFSAYSLSDAGLSWSDIKPGLTINVKGAYERLYWFERRHMMLDTVRLSCERFLKETEKLPKVFDMMAGEEKE